MPTIEAEAIMKKSILLLLIIALISSPATAEKPETTNVGPPLTKHLCPSAHLLSSLVSEREYSKLPERVKSFCRKTISWSSGRSWLCLISGEVFLIEYPVAKVGIPPATFENREIDFIKNNLQCLSFEEDCRGRYFYFDQKVCWNKRVSGSGYWESLANNANQPAVKLEESCHQAELITLITRTIRTDCTEEACVLTDRNIWRNVLKLLEPDLETNEDRREMILDEIAPTEIIRAKPNQLSSVTRPGVYCADVEKDTKLKALDPDIKNHFSLRSSPILALTAPKDYPQTKIIRQSNDKSVPDDYRCKSNADCFQGKGGTCMTKQMAEHLPVHNDESYRCICQTGPVFYGCVAQK